MPRRQAHLILRAQPGLIVKNELDNFSPPQALLFGNWTVVVSTPAAISMPCSVTSWGSASTAPSKTQCSGVIRAESLVCAPAPFVGIRAYDPQRVDQCSGVQPALLLTFRSALAARNISTISSLFAAAAKYNGVRSIVWHFSSRPKP